MSGPLTAQWPTGGQSEASSAGELGASGGDNFTFELPASNDQGRPAVLEARPMVVTKARDDGSALRLYAEVTPEGAVASTGGK